MPTRCVRPPPHPAPHPAAPPFILRTAVVPFRFPDARRFVSIAAGWRSCFYTEKADWTLALGIPHRTFYASLGGGARQVPARHRRYTVWWSVRRSEWVASAVFTARAFRQLFVVGADLVFPEKIKLTSDSASLAPICCAGKDDALARCAPSPNREGLFFVCTRCIPALVHARAAL